MFHDGKVVKKREAESTEQKAESKKQKATGADDWPETWSG
jgi:hypothetical protein